MIEEREQFIKDRDKERKEIQFFPRRGNEDFPSFM